MEPPVSFGLWIRQRRKALDLTQDELAARVGYSVSAIRKIEADERRPSRQVAALLADCLEIPEEERATFIKVARAELRVERLAPPTSKGRPTLPGQFVSEPDRQAAAVFQPEGKDVPAVKAAQLPVPPSALIGRELELRELHRLLTSAECRLLTLIGPGGIGKTRLAVQAAHEVAPAFRDGACFVSLAPLASAEFIVPAIADAVAFGFSGQREPKTQLLDFLREKPLLLVLDNLEHLLSGAGLLSELLQAAPGLKILVTSRERLNLLGEWIFEIHSLPVPAELLPVERLADYSSVALFIQRALRISPGFELNEQNSADIVRICQLMEGTPLGIELAAAWTRMLSCQEIAEEIERNLDFLATSLRDVPERHRSLRAAFDHSWNLLNADEAAVLRKVSIFRGSFQRQPAAQIAGANLTLLSALVDKSVLRRSERERYNLHELMRPYAANRLGDFPDEQAQAAERHAEYFLGFVAERADRFNQDRQAVEEVRAELEDLRAAWGWALSARRFDLITAATQGLAGFYRLTGLLREGEKSIEKAVALARDRAQEGYDFPAGLPASAILCQLYAAQAGLLNDRGIYPRAAESAQEAVELAQAVRDTRSETLGNLEWGQALWRQGDYPGAFQRLELALSQARAHQWPHLEADSLRTLGVVLLYQGNYTQALNQLDAAFHLHRAIGDRRGESKAYNRLGTAFYLYGDLQQAEIYFENARQVFIEVGDRRGEGRALNNLGLVLQTQGDNFKGRDYFQRGLDVILETGDRWGEVASYSNLGVSLHRLGDFQAARRCYSHALEVAGEIGDRSGEAGGLTSLGLLAYHQKDPASALEYNRQALEIATQANLLTFQSYALTRLGRLALDQGEADLASQAFDQALNLWRELRRENMTLEPLAGLACLALDREDLAAARAHSDEILALLERPETHILAHADDPYWVYLVVHRTLELAQDARADAVLKEAAAQLEKQAGFIHDKSQRQDFLQSLPSCREILQRAEQML